MPYVLERLVEEEMSLYDRAKRATSQAQRSAMMERLARVADLIERHKNTGIRNPHP